MHSIPISKNGTLTWTGSKRRHRSYEPCDYIQPKFCPFAPQGLAASNATMGRSDSRPGPSTELLLPLWRRARAACALPALPGLPGSPTVLWIHAASKHPGRPDAMLLLSNGAGGRLPHKLGGSPPPRFILTRPNRVRSRCGLHPVPVLTTWTGSLDTSGYPWCRAVTSW